MKISRSLASAFSVAMLTAALTLSGCSDSCETGVSGASSASGGKPEVYVVNYPLKYFAGRIAGDLATVVFPAPGDEDPAFWQPGDEEIAAYQGADLILLNGATYAKWTDKVTLPAETEVDTSKAFADSFIVVQSSVTHSHGPGGEHSHSGTAFTTWIDFTQALAQAQAARDALVDLLPDAKDQLDANFEALKKDLEALQQRMRAAAGKIGTQPLVASHPVYQYWARQYAINLEAVLWEPETVPDADQMKGLQDILAKHPAKWMVWEGEPAAESVAKLKEIGVDSVVFDPCGNVPDSGDWLSVMNGNIDNLEAAFGGK